MDNHISDRLGLSDPISRRDFLNGVLLTGAGLLLQGKAPTISPDDAFNGYGRNSIREADRAVKQLVGM